MDEFIYIYFCVLSAAFGAVFGSFCNVLIYRVPRGESVVKGGSHCTSCGQPIKFYDNIPVVSYIVLRGRCRHCKQKFTPRYFIVEVLCMLLWLGFALLAKRFGYVYSICCMGVSLCVVAVAFTDYENGYIPDRYNVVIAAFGAFLCVYGIFAETYVSWRSRLLGLAFSVLFYGGAYAVSKWIFKREGIGFGDVKFMAACGLFLGIKAAFVATLAATITASAVLVTLSVRRGEKKKEYPFAPFLGAGVIIAAFLGEIAANAYLALF